VRTLTLAESPAVMLLQHLPEADARAGAAAFTAVEGVHVFIDPAFGSPPLRTPCQRAPLETLTHAALWEMTLPGGALFPQIMTGELRRIERPLTILSGARSKPF
jgi:hypothetical protein